MPPISFLTHPVPQRGTMRNGGVQGCPRSDPAGRGRADNETWSEESPRRAPGPKADSAHPALYEHSHGWAGGNICDVSHDVTGDRAHPEDVMAGRQRERTVRRGERG
ncbi:protein of unknown function [Streptantibioticus cattleyicolor NRRL 8057 = DSM 46488]|nr:protein of unknown function [Streptantibioticus cattleyicolor NRRL 8057 = DSM 46488]